MKLYIKIDTEQMTYKSWTSYATLKIKSFFLVLAFGLVLLNASIANGKAERDGKRPSCKTLRLMARVYMAYGEYAKAQPLAEQALALARRKKAPDCELAMCLIDLATLYRYQGKLIDSEKMCKQGLKLQEKVYYKNHPYIAHTLRTLSSVYKAQGKYHDAHSALNKAMRILLDSHSADDRAITPLQVDIAELLVAQGDFEKAESYYLRSITLITGSYGPDHLYTAYVSAGLAELYTLQKRYVEAEELVNRAMTTQERIYSPDHHLVAPAWLTKAKICQAKGDYIRSEKLIEKALSAVRKTGNIATFAKMKQLADKIRASAAVTTAPIARATK